MTRLTIRPLEPQDEGAWSPLWARYLAQLGFATAEAPLGAWSRVSGGDASLGGLGAWAGGDLAGALHYARHAHPWAEGGAWLITDVFTDERMRGRGVARALLETMFQRATEAGAAWAWGPVRADNATARVLYAQLAADVGQVVYRRVL